MTARNVCSRRSFLGYSSSCAAHIALLGLPFSLSRKTRWTSIKHGKVVAQEPFGRLEEVGDGLYALISTPLSGDYTTLSNGGIIAGSAGVLVVESFASVEGASWLAQEARDLTGRWPTHVAITHYHGDHSAGLAGYFPAETGPTVWATDSTRAQVLARATRDDPQRDRLWAEMRILGVDRPTTIDLGSRTVRLVPRSGHTASDVTIELDGESIVWCGDLVWSGMFPNYVDAAPSVLSDSVRRLQRRAWSTYVPGHGPLADQGELDRYVSVLDDVEAAARTAFERGWTAKEAGSRYEIPAALGEWILFNPQYYERAIGTWLRELATSG